MINQLEVTLIFQTEVPSTFSLPSDDISTYVSPNDEAAPQQDIICSRRIDLIHSGHLMNILYEQHK